MCIILIPNFLKIQLRHPPVYFVSMQNPRTNLKFLVFAFVGVVIHLVFVLGQQRLRTDPVDVSI